LAKLSSIVNIPIIASGEQVICSILDSFKEGKKRCSIAASVFHFKEIEIKTKKENNNIELESNF
jgi:cyclase